MNINKKITMALFSTLILTGAQSGYAGDASKDIPEFYLKSVIPLAGYENIYKIDLKITNKLKAPTKIQDIFFQPPSTTSDNVEFKVISTDISKCDSVGADAYCPATAIISASKSYVDSSMPISVQIPVQIDR